jgi:Holliday junction resolvasome RuvABC endonuclease subunit
MIILALDQATVNTAYSVWVNSKLITHGKVTADEKIKDYRRSLQMVDLVMKKVEEYKPDLVVLEGAFSNGNIKTFGMLSCLRGMTMERLKDEGYKFEIVEPVIWKSFAKIKGKRPEQKKQSIALAERIFGLELFDDDDIADSINIGCWAVNKYDGINYYE